VGIGRSSEGMYGVEKESGFPEVFLDGSEVAWAVDRQIIKRFRALIPIKAVSSHGSSQTIKSTVFPLSGDAIPCLHLRIQSIFSDVGMSQHLSS
jgi:hypothetical protein